MTVPHTSIDSYLIIRHNHGTEAEITIISRELDKEDAKLIAGESHQQPVWHVVVLGALTFYVYLIYWAYKTWTLLKAEAGDDAKVQAHPALSIFKNVNPALRTGALMLPLLINFIPLMHPLLKEVIATAVMVFVLAPPFIGMAELVPDENSFPRKRPLVCCGLVLALAFVINGAAKLHSIWYLLSVLGFSSACAIAQHWLNRYWTAVEPADLQVRHGFNGVEMVAIILGALLLGLNAAGSMIGIKTP